MVFRVTAALTIGLVALFFTAKAVAWHEVQVSGYHGPPPGTRTPSAVGLQYDDFSLRSGDRTLKAWYVSANDPKAPAVLIYHGDGETLSYWVDALSILHRAGISAMIFDYSGYGASTGKPSYANLGEDAIAGYRDFLERTPHASTHAVLGSSMGNALILDAYAQAHLPIDRAVFTGAWGSVRSVVGRTGRFPSTLVFLLPDVYDNIEQAKNLDVPLLVVEGGNDTVAPLDEAQRIERAASGEKTLVTLPGYGHNAPWKNPTADFYGPIVQFITHAAKR